MRASIKGVFAASLLAIWPGVAAAVPAQVQTDLNVRFGPGTDYGVVDVLPGGVTIDVLACYSGWCEISWEGFDGFASGAYLDIPAAVTVVAPTSRALLVPGVIVYESRYYDRPVWARGGRIIREAIRRDIRRDAWRDARRDIRHVRREVRGEQRANARAVERRRDNRMELRRHEAHSHISQRHTRISDRNRNRHQIAAQAHHRQRANMRIHARQPIHRQAAERAHAESRNAPRGFERRQGRRGGHGNVHSRRRD
jgi:uncharacterized protein YraI